MPICGHIFEWDDKHKVPLDEIITIASKYKSPLIYRIDDWDHNTVKAIVARTYDEAIELLIERDIDSDDYLYPMEPWESADKSIDELLSTGKVNFKLLIKSIKESLKPWEPPYRYNTEGYRNSHTCPMCGHKFKE